MSHHAPANPALPTEHSVLPAAEENRRSVVLAHLAGQEVGRIPVMPITMMFAAHLTGVRYGDYCCDHRLLARAQLAVAEHFHFDHVSCISDPTREASDLGAQITWFDDQPPAMDESAALLADPRRLVRLVAPEPTSGPRMLDRVRAAETLRRAAPRRIVEGWVEGPCGEAATLRGINTLMLDFYDDPAFVNDLFDFVTGLAERFARAQVEAGVDVVGIGDPAASLVGPHFYAEFVWPRERRLIEAVHRLGAKARLHICGDTSRLVGLMGQLDADIVDLDSPVSLAEARAAVGPNQVLLGNLAPVSIMFEGTRQQVTDELARCHAAAGSRWVIGAGCEIPRGTAPENVAALAAYGRSLQSATSPVQTR
jgi:MtaA/CmuA family methyltransferase